MSKKFYLMIGAVVLIALMSLVPFIGAQDDNVDIYGRALPEDAAPYEMQIMQNLCDSQRTEFALSSAVSVYSRTCSQNIFDKFSD